MLECHNQYDIDYNRLVLLHNVIDTYYETYVTGGSLHIVLDDHNMDRESIEFCRDYAREHHDPIGEGIARLMLELSDDMIERWRRAFEQAPSFADAHDFATSMTQESVGGWWWNDSAEDDC